jgi:hypothetical protein
MQGLAVGTKVGSASIGFERNKARRYDLWPNHKGDAELFVKASMFSSNINDAPGNGCAQPPILAINLASCSTEHVRQHNQLARM